MYRLFSFYRNADAVVAETEGDGQINSHGATIGVTRVLHVGCT